MGAKFDISQGDEISKWLKKGTKQTIERAALATAARLVNHIQTDVIPSTEPIPVDRGLYRAAWRYKKVPGGAEVFNTSPHAPMIEYGVRAKNVKAGRKMIDALAAWVRRKGIAGKGKGANARAEARSMAFAIARSMRRKGIFHGGKGLRILERAVKRVPKFFNEELVREIKRAFKSA